MPVRRLRQLRATADRGAVAMVVALLLGSGVLLGMAALVVDVGNIYVERTQLQSGADAGAVKVAQMCATDPVCARTAAAVARKYANANSNDNRSRVSVVCGHGGGLAACPAPARGLADCVNAAPATGDYVEVRTSTLQADGSTLLPPAFAAAVSGYRGTTFTACSRASWGAPTTGRLGVTISACEWNRYTLGSARFPDPPVEQVIYPHDDPAAGTCRPPGQPADIPGGFGTLADPRNDCRTAVALSGSYDGDSGRGVSAHCRAVLAEARTNGRPLLVPIFGPVGGGTAPRYTVVGFAAFMVTGWDLPGSAARSTLTGRSTCPSSTTCIFGYFTRATVPGGGPTGGPDLGAYTVGLVG
jgi:Flp pilus assembly protein TadG